MKDIFCTAVCLAGGSGSRMKSSVSKQYMLINDKPLIWYALNAFQNSSYINEIVLVAKPDDIEYMQNEIVNKYNFDKVSVVVAGGSERFLSVLNGIKNIVSRQDKEQIILIHDGARPFVNDKIIGDTIKAASDFGACVAAVPSKDTIKISDEDGFVVATPNRKNVWNIQTPQVFKADLIKNAYGSLEKDVVAEKNIFVTDDASVVELYSDVKVKLVEASYENIKITTPEDIKIAESILGE